MVTEDKKFSGLDLVPTPAPSDEFGCAQGGDSFKQTRLQLHTLQVGESFDSVPATPHILKVGGVEGLRLTKVSGSILQAPEANVGLTADVGSSQGDGIITSSYNVYSVVANAGDAATLPAVFVIDTLLYVKNDGAESMDVFPANGDNAGAGTDVAIAIGSGQSAVFIATAANATWTQLISGGTGGDVTKVGTPLNNQIGIWTGDGTIEGDPKLTWNGSIFNVDGTIQTDAATGPALLDIGGGFTVPSVLPNKTDLTTGLAIGGAFALSLVAGGNEAIRLTKSGGGVLQTPAANISLTAFAGGGQASATALVNSYNVISVVATTGDSVKLAPSFPVNTVLYVKNDGPNAADIFPATGDDLGLGVNIAISVPAGQAKVFIATVANATWTELLPSAVSAGDVFKVGTPVNNQIGVWTGDGTIEGNSGLTFDNTDLIFSAAGIIRGNGVNSYALRNVAASLTNPTICPDRTDLNTGLGHQSADRINIIAGAIIGTQWREASSHILKYDELHTSITASTTQTQGQVALLSSWNEITIVANANDVVTLPGATVGLKCTVINSGANILQIFPASGDNLGAGLNTSTTLSPGESLTFIGLDTTNWQVSSISVGGGDVTKVGTPVDNQIAVWTGDGTIEGDSGLVWDGTDLTVAGAIRVFRTDSAAMFNIAPTATVPTLVPNRSDPNTGIGWGGSLDELILVAGGVEGISIAESGGGITLTMNGPATFDGLISVAASNGPSLRDTTATAIVPTVNPNKIDPNSGIGWPGVDQLSLVAGGLDCINIAETGSVRQLAFYVTAPISLQTGVAVSSAGIHAALVNLGLITA